MFETVIDYIARTNLFNFIIFAGIIAFLFIKLDVSGVLRKGAENTAEEITNSETAKSESEESLHSVEEKVANLADEVGKIIKQSEDNANNIGEQIITDANKSAVRIQENTAKIIENKTVLLRNDIMKRASLASVEVAKNHIIKELDNNYDLHNRLIDESIEAINGVDV
jgi:F0F1-type ATP synthase membrane subunit b/b'